MVEYTEQNISDYLQLLLKIDDLRLEENSIIVKKEVDKASIITYLHKSLSVFSNNKIDNPSLMVIKELLKQEPKGKRLKFIELAKSLSEKIEGEKKHGVADYLDLLEKEGNEEIIDSDLFAEIKKRKREDLPCFENFFESFFQPVENWYLVNKKFPQQYRSFNELLNYFSYEYDPDVNPTSFSPGQLFFNPERHEKYLSNKSDYSNNSIIEVLKPGIKTISNETYFRKSLINLSFNI